MEQWFQKNCSWALPRSRRPSSTSQHSNAPEVRPTTIPTNAPSPSVSRSLPLSQPQGTESQGTSRVDFVKPNIVVNQPSAEPDLTGSSTGEHIGLPRVYR